MNNFIQIQKTNHSPEVTFTQDGAITFKGELRTEHPEIFFIEVKNSIDSNLKESQNLEFTDLTLTFRFDYIGSSNSLELFNFIKYAQEKNMKLIWEYESIDEDLEELGDIIKAGYASDMELKKFI